MPLRCPAGEARPSRDGTDTLVEAGLLLKKSLLEVNDCAHQRGDALGTPEPAQHDLPGNDREMGIEESGFFRDRFRFNGPYHDLQETNGTRRHWK